MYTDYARWVGPMRISSILVLLALTGGCATAPSPNAEAPTAASSAVRPARITLELERGPVGEAVRRIGQSSTVSIVLMNGLEDFVAGPFVFDEADAATVAAALVREAISPKDGSNVACSATPRGGYWFIHPPQYASLNDLSLEGRLPAEFAGIETSAAFGAGTALYNVFALLGHALGVTLVADNAVAEARCGELALSGVPLSSALEAILKSARIHAQAIDIETGENYALFRNTTNPPRRMLLLNADRLGPGVEGFLDERVNVVLPKLQKTTNHFESLPGADVLGNVLGPLSKQLGVAVTIEQGLERLPVNPVVMRNVTRRTAVELLIKQWLSPEFGYEATAQGIVIRYAGPE